MVSPASAVKLLKRDREEDFAQQDMKVISAHIYDVDSKSIQQGEEIVRFSSAVIKEMQKLAKYRKKTEILKERSCKLKHLVTLRGESLSRLEHKADVLASAEAPQRDVVSEVQEALGKARGSHEEATQDLYLLVKRIESLKFNIEWSRDNLEDGLGLLLCDRGYFNTSVTDSECSLIDSKRSSKRAHTKPGTVEMLCNSDPDIEKKRAALARLEESKARYQDAAYRFENRSEMYRNGLEEWQRRVSTGECSLTRTDFDVEYCHLYGDLGIDLDEAEVERSKAALEMKRTRAQSTTYSQTSKFIDDPRDAEGLACETEHAISTLDTSKVQVWLQSLQGDESVQQQIELQHDDWDVRSLQYGKSCNGISNSWTKLRLKRWNRAREEWWETMKKGLEGTIQLPGQSDEAEGTQNDG